MFQPGGPTLRELLVQSLQSTERGYDLLAPKFDKTPFRTPDGIVEPLVRLLGGPKSIDSALDVCCGTGAAMAYLRPLCRERVVGIDFSAGMLAEAKRRLESAPGDARVELVRGDARAMPFHDEFDVATCVGALGHIVGDDQDRFVASIARALRPGGRFAFATAEMPPVWSPARWIARGFNAAMHVRNAVRKPEFVMFYLTFLWPGVRALLARHGLRAEPHFGACARPFERVVLVVATRER